MEIKISIRGNVYSVCIGYKTEAKGYIPPKDSDYEKVNPLYTYIKWDGHDGRSQLVNLIEEHVGIPVTMVSSGTKKESMSL